MIEQLANMIIMVNYPWFYYNQGMQYEVEPEKDYYEFRITKNRDGEVGPIEARFIKHIGDFERAVNDYTDTVEEVVDLPWQ